MVEQQDRRSFRSRYVDQSYLGDASKNELPPYSLAVQKHYNHYSNYHRLSGVSVAAPDNWFGMATRLEQSLMLARLD